MLSYAGVHIVPIAQPFFYFFIQVLHVFIKNLQSSGTMSFGVPGNQLVKVCPKVNQIQDN